MGCPCPLGARRPLDRQFCIGTTMPRTPHRRGARSGRPLRVATRSITHFSRRAGPQGSSGKPAGRNAPCCTGPRGRRRRQWRRLVRAQPQRQPNSSSASPNAPPNVLLVLVGVWARSRTQACVPCPPVPAQRQQVCAPGACWGLSGNRQGAGRGSGAGAPRRMTGPGQHAAEAAPAAALMRWSRFPAPCLPLRRRSPSFNHVHGTALQPSFTAAANPQVAASWLQVVIQACGGVFTAGGSKEAVGRRGTASETYKAAAAWEDESTLNRRRIDQQGGVPACHGAALLAATKPAIRPAIHQAQGTTWMCARSTRRSPAR